MSWSWSWSWSWRVWSWSWPNLVGSLELESWSWSYHILLMLPITTIVALEGSEVIASGRDGGRNICSSEMIILMTSSCTLASNKFEDNTDDCVIFECCFAKEAFCDKTAQKRNQDSLKPQFCVVRKRDICSKSNSCTTLHAPKQLPALKLCPAFSRRLRRGEGRS